MKENYIFGLEYIKDKIENDPEATAECRLELEQIKNVASTISYNELQVINYLRMVDGDGEALIILKKLKKLKEQYIQTILRSFNIWELDDEYDYVKEQKENYEEYIKLKEKRKV